MKKILIAITLVLILISCENYELKYQQTQDLLEQKEEEIQTKESIIANISKELQSQVAISIAKDSVHLSELRESRRKLSYYRSKYNEANVAKDDLIKRGISSLTVDERRKFINENLNYIIQEFNLN